MFTDRLLGTNRKTTIPAINPDPVPHINPYLTATAGNYLTGLRVSRYAGIAEVVVTGIEDTAVPHPIQNIAPVRQVRILPLPVLGKTGAVNG